MTDARGTSLCVFQRRALLAFAMFSLLPIIITATVNYEIDPFQYFRVSHPAQFSNLMQRFQVPGIIRNYDFDSIVVGNSVVANLQNWMFDRPEFPDKPKVMNLSFWGSTIREDSYVVALALKSKPIKTVYWSIGRQLVFEEFRYADFPTCMYGGVYRFMPPYCYLLNSNVLWESYVSLSHPKFNYNKDAWSQDIGQWKTYGPAKIDRHTHACEIQKLVKLDDIDRLTWAAESDLGPTNGAKYERYHDLVLPIVRANPNVRFVFLFAPVYLSHFWREAVNGSIRTERALIDLFSLEPNAEIHDMTGLALITHDLGHYRDDIHYDAEGAQHVVAALATGSMKINSIDQHEKMLREELEAGAELMHSYLSERCP
jgi:hypothetical protein